MNKTLRIIRVFIASPGDTVEARDCVRKAVERINRLVAKPNDIFLEAIGWEDIPTGKAQRTQDLINPYVDAANIFIGILNKRFGEPTGIAESGTEEEYQRASNRWENEIPPPEVKIFFKKLSKDDTVDPGPQLQRVLDFKSRISQTDLYREFGTIERLGETVEDELADWIYKFCEASTKIGHEDAVETLQPIDLDILAAIIKHGPMTNDGIITHFDNVKDQINDAFHRLQKYGFLIRTKSENKLTNSTEGFVSIVKHLNTDKYYRMLLKSEYYDRMLKTCLSGLIDARFHYRLQPEPLEVLRNLSLLSPSVAAYLLFGDTTLYDNLTEHSKRIGQEQYANEIIWNNIIHHTLLLYGADSINGYLLDVIDGKPLAGQIFAIRLVAAYQDNKAFEIQSVVPSMRLRAGENLEKNQMVTGSPGIFVQIGTILMHMGEFGLALKEFEKAATLKSPFDVKFAALNNKGLALLQLDKITEAIDAFQQAIDLDPTRPEPKKNLELAKKSLEDRKS